MTSKMRTLHAGLAAPLAAVALLALSQGWATLQISAPGLPAVTELVEGQKLAPLAGAAMLAVLAAALALLALRRWAVYVIAGVMLAAALASTYGAASYLADPLTRALAVAGLRVAPDVSIELTNSGVVWAILLMGAGVGLAGVALSMVLRVRTGVTADLPTKYERTKPTSGEVGDTAIWDAQDGGMDLTSDRPKTT